MKVNKYGPPIMYSSLLFISSLICFILALADSYEMLIETCLNTTCTYTPGVK
jgi:hypothetical protein